MLYSFFIFTPHMKIEQAELSETSAYKTQMLKNHPKERIQHSEHGKFEIKNDLMLSVDS